MMKKQKRTKKVLATALTVGMLMGAMSAPVEAASAGWKKDATGWWYQNANGSYPKNKWEKINGSWYYFDNNGYMKANQWVQDKDGKWYYVGSSGAMMANQWIKGKAGEWYYLDSTGAMKTNSWLEYKDDWYYFGADGVMKTDTMINSSGKSYYMDSEGIMVTNEWVNDKGKDYYIGNDGVLLIDENGRIKIEDITFKVDDSWTMVIGASDGVIYVDYDVNMEIENNFFAVVEEVEKEMEDDVLKYVRDSILREYEDEASIKIIEEGMVDIPFGKAYSVIVAMTDEDQYEETESVYVKQVVLINKNKIYGFQMMCLDGNFADAEQRFDAIVASISK